MVEVSNFVGPIQFIFNALIKLFTAYFEGKEFMELSKGLFKKKIMLPDELLTISVS
jgi:hypothetical protein